VTKRKPEELSDAEEARVQAQIAADPDDGEPTEADLARAKPFGRAFPALMDSIKRSRGRPRKAEPKEAVTLRLDPHTLRKFKSTGENWRARMSEILDKAKL